jgi:hypothetical protein
LIIYIIYLYSTCTHGQLEDYLFFPFLFLINLISL